MSESKRGSSLVDEADTVEIALEDIPPRPPRASRTSSTSTSSFEDLNSPRLERNGSKRENEALPVESHNGKDSPKGALTFKTTSLDDPAYYAQTTSLTSSPAVTSARTPGRTSDFRAPTSARMNDRDRDPENVNDVVKIRFEEVFAEPEGAYSFGTIWGASFRIFTDTKLWCYKFLSAMFAVPCAFCWGLHFACLSFCQIWYYQPGIRSLKIQIRPMSTVYSICVKNFIEPCFDSIGKIFSSIRIHKALE